MVNIYASEEPRAIIDLQTKNVSTTALFDKFKAAHQAVSKAEAIATWENFNLHETIFIEKYVINNL